MQAEDSREILAERIRNLLASYPNVRERRMFGGVSFMVDNRLAVAAGRDGNLLVRVSPSDYGNLLQQGAQPAQMGSNRPMGRGWLTVPGRLIASTDSLTRWVTVGTDSRTS